LGRREAEVRQVVKDAATDGDRFGAEDTE